MPSTTRSWTFFHCARAAGAAVSLERITSARLNGTPAASRLERSRVKFSSSLVETFFDSNLKERLPDEFLSAAPFFAAADLDLDFAAAASARLIGRRPSVSI